MLDITTMSEEEITELKELYKNSSDYEIQKQEDEYGYWIEDPYASFQDLINNPDYYRLIKIIC